MTKVESDAILKKLGEIELLLAARSHIDEDFVELKKELEGNGKPGFRKVRDVVIEWENNRKFYTRAIVSVVITNFAALLFAAVIWFVKIYPLLEKLSKLESAGL